jgi:hypothetical protein
VPIGECGQARRFESRRSRRLINDLRDALYLSDSSRMVHEKASWQDKRFLLSLCLNLPNVEAQSYKDH